MDQLEVLEQLQNDDRRRHCRVCKGFRMRFGVLEDLSIVQVSQPGDLLDISGGGLRFLADHRLPGGGQILLELEIPGWRVVDGDWQPSDSEEDAGVLRIVAQIVWTALDTARKGKYQTGVRFTGQVK